MSTHKLYRALLSGLAFLLSLSGCGGGGSDTSASLGTTSLAAQSCSSDCGSVYIGLTDADGDFLSYTVDVLSLTLKRANGTTVETLPATTRVDFAQYVDVTEFLTSASVPRGNYVSATLRLDYSNAAITVEKNGQPVAASVVDENGNAIATRDVTVTLDNHSPLVVAAGRPALLTLDFDLAATNSVDLTTTPPTVTASPTLVASLEPVAEKDLRIRGPLVSVDTANANYVVNVRPFHHRIGDFGQVTVHTDSNTSYEINGTQYAGAAGLQALAAAGAGTLTAAFGSLDTATHTFTAEHVLGGTSVPGQNFDAILGNVVARSGNVLTVRGATIEHRDDNGVSDPDDWSFSRGQVQITIGPNTKILKDGDTSGTVLGPEAISVGQRINAFGTLSSSGDQFDATAGRVRLHLTHLLGMVVTKAGGQLTMSLNSIDGRDIGAFNFAGTGTASAYDADPNNYIVSTGSLTLDGVSAGKAARVFGFAAPFGSAPPDFTARTVVGYADLHAQLGIGWGMAGTATPFSSLSATGLVLDLSNTAIGNRHYLRVGPLYFSLLSLPSSPMIVPPSSDATLYVVATATGSKMFTSFADFTAEVSAQLSANAKLLGFSAGGTYDGTTNVVTAQEAVAFFKPST